MTTSTQTSRAPLPPEPLANQALPAAETAAEPGLQLPQRPGPRPRTGPVAHAQLDQNGPIPIQEALWQRMEALPGVRPGHSGISAPTTRAVHLDPAAARGPGSAFIVGSEFAHLHGPNDGSLHLTLPELAVETVIRRGWGELHPVARKGLRPPTLVMLYSPRDADELDTVWRLVEASYAFARAKPGTESPARPERSDRADAGADRPHLDHVGPQETTS